MGEGFKMPPIVPDPDDGKKEGKVEGRMELTREEKYKLVGKKDSLLDKRGVHISINKLDELIASGLVISDLTDTDAVAAAIISKLDESREIKRLAEIQENVEFRKNEIRKYVAKYGLNEFATGLVDEWKAQSLNWVKIDGTIRAQIVHNLNISELHRAAGDAATALSAAKEAYDLAVDEGDVSMVAQILEEFPDVKQEEE